MIKGFKILRKRLTCYEPPDWETKYKVFPGERPWWEILEPTERCEMNHRQRCRSYNQRHPEACRNISKRYYKRHPERCQKRCQEWYRKNSETIKEKERAYHRTPEGRAFCAKKKANRRKRSTDPASYGARVELLHTMRESCAKCGAQYQTTYMIDHIVALCNGGTDDWDNLQPLCVTCHREKTGKDLAEYGKCRRLAKTNLEECLVE